MGRRFVLGALVLTGVAASAAAVDAVDKVTMRKLDAIGDSDPLPSPRRSVWRGRLPTATASPTPVVRHPQHPTAHVVRHSHRGGHHVPVQAQPVYYVEDGPNVIALTIDDGPNPEYTPQILEILQRHGVKASFSMIGMSVAGYPSIARDVADAGHVIVNHTWSHADLATLSASNVRDQVTRASDAIHNATGAHPAMLRAPYGAWSPAVLEYCTSAGLTPLDWSVDPQDWSRPGVREIVRTIMGTTRSGSIILEHDGGGDRSQTVAALSIVLPRLLDEGYRFALP